MDSRQDTGSRDYDRRGDTQSTSRYRVADPARCDADSIFKDEKTEVAVPRKQKSEMAAPRERKISVHAKDVDARRSPSRPKSRTELKTGQISITARRCAVQKSDRNYGRITSG